MYLKLLLPPPDADVVEDGADDDDFPARLYSALRVFSMGYFFLIILKMFSVEIVLTLESLVLNSALAGSTRASLLGYGFMRTSLMPC